jgi:hypothetical protein
MIQHKTRLLILYGGIVNWICGGDLMAIDVNQINESSTLNVDSDNCCSPESDRKSHDSDKI